MSETSKEKKKKSLPDFALWGQGMLQANEDEAASKPPLPGLYLVSTPIGNLGDISLRALWILAQADAILCEDTRVTGGMLHRYGIKKPLISCHDHNEAQREGEVIARLSRGEVLALVSDAGTPMISDPGFRLVRACRAAGQNVVAVPGASAVLTAMACAGLPSDRFLFVGFLPAKKTARHKAIAELAAMQATLVFYESPNRLTDCLADLVAELGAGREAVVGRELTKLYEEVTPSTLGELATHYEEAEAPKGEIVILVAPPSESAGQADAEDLDEAIRHALETMSLRDAAAYVAATLNLKKSEVYQRALKLSAE